MSVATRSRRFAATAVLVLVSCWSLPTAARAQDETEGVSNRRPFLWVVNSEPKIYLFGTMHSNDPRIVNHPAAVRAALDEADAVYTEVRMGEDLKETRRRRAKLPEGQSLRDLLDSRLYERTAHWMNELFVPLSALDGQQPWDIRRRLAYVGVDKSRQHEPLLDQRIFAEAKQTKTVDGLEEPHEAFDLFDEFLLEEHIWLLCWTVEGLDRNAARGVNSYRMIRDAYISGDLDRLSRLFRGYEYGCCRSANPLAIRFNNHMVDRRNAGFLRRLLRKAEAAPDKVHFAAIGVAHFVGPDGIPALLRRTGYRVRRVDTIAQLKDPFPLRKRVDGLVPTGQSRACRRTCIGLWLPPCLSFRCCW